MSDELNEYSLGIMSGCLKGRVPMLVDIADAANRCLPVKYIVMHSKLPVYGEIESFDNSLNRIDFRLGSQALIQDIRLEGILLFSAAPLDPLIPTHVGTTLIIGEDLFTVIRSNDKGMTVWLGSEGLIYYGEDIQSIIVENSDYILLGVTS